MPGVKIFALIVAWLTLLGTLAVWGYTWRVGLRARKVGVLTWWAGPMTGALAVSLGVLAMYLAITWP